MWNHNKFITLIKSRFFTKLSNKCIQFEKYKQGNNCKKKVKESESNHQ